jgi:SAM-dependent methyltransferase
MASEGMYSMWRKKVDDDFAEELDLDFYRRNHPDLRSMSNAQAREHFARFGITEGRQGSPLAVREALIEIVRTMPSVLEIGPFCNPLIRGRGVAYLDVLDKTSLQRRATTIGQDPRGVPEIDYVSPTGDLSVVPDRFSAVVSSHCIEHQPDLIRHLKQVGDLLDSGGYYFLVVPNRLYCFDHFIADSTLAGIVAAHVEGRRVHRLESVIEHRALTTHNAVKRHWDRDHLDPNYYATILSRTKAALDEFAAARGNYIDVHAWQFTPGSFRSIMTMLHAGGYSPLEPIRVYETPKGRNEFTAILLKDG